MYRKLRSHSGIFLVLLIGMILSSPIAYGAAPITSHSATVGLDRTTYPIPAETRDLKISIQIFDPDFNISPNGIDKIAQDLPGEPGVGPIKISITRGDTVVLGYAGGKSANNGKLDSKPLESLPSEKSKIRQFGSITETSPSSGIFEFDVTIKNIDGPESSKCPVSSQTQKRFDDAGAFARHCILQGDVLLVEYSDPTDASGNPRSVSASATFSLVNPVPSFGSSSEKLTASKNVRIGHPLTLLLYDSNLNLDSDKAETYTLDLIRFESDKVKTTLGPKGGVQDAFNPRPSALRETGENTGIFYTVIEIPRTLKGQRIDVGEKIEFEYTQRGLGAFLVVRQGSFSPDKIDTPKNSAKLFMNAKSFRFGQPVEVTLIDPDLNQNSDLVDIYKVVDNPNSPFVDTVGSASGGILLEIKIKDIRYARCTINGVEHGGLASTGFTLLETGTSTGIFKGTFKVPSKICDKSGTKLISSAGGNIKLIYHDFRDSSGQRNIQSTR